MGLGPYVTDRYMVVHGAGVESCTSSHLPFTGRGSELAMFDCLGVAYRSLATLQWALPISRALSLPSCQPLDDGMSFPDILGRCVAFDQGYSNQHA